MEGESIKVGQTFPRHAVYVLFPVALAWASRLAPLRASRCITLFALWASGGPVRVSILAT